VDRIDAWANRAIRRIEQGVLNDLSVDELAESLGVSGRQLRRALHDRFGVSPIQLAQTQRLLTAKQLLADTRLPVGEIAEISGFSSLRRFNATFQERYRMSPSALRKAGRSAAGHDSVRCELGYRPPFSWTGLLDFLRPRALRGVEIVGENSYSRSVRIAALIGWINVEPHADRTSLVITVSESLVPRLPTVLERVRRLFDLSAEPEPIRATLGPLAEADPGLRVPGAFDGFETAVRAILGQQVTVRFAGELAGRMAAEFGTPIQTPWPEVGLVFPSAREVANLPQERLGELGVIRTRSRAILELADRIAAGTVRLEPDGDPDLVRAKLREIPGIGDWTADYISMRCLSWPDAFPAGDLGVLKALDLTKPKDALAASEAWRPWRAYAVMHLWRRLSSAADSNKGTK
jgi:AraC family transcriptional regulator of adaptative response / DNA-3-methyladenine glycosylase II